MKLSNETRSFINDLVHLYSKQDDFSQYYLTQEMLPEEDIDKLVALISQDEPELICEATGPDNDHYQSILLPSMIKYFSDSCNKEKEIDFAQEYKKGVCKYFSKSIAKLLEEYVENYNQDHQLFPDEPHYRREKIVDNSIDWRTNYG